MKDYDICVDSDTLTAAREKLVSIEGNILDSANSMLNAIDHADGFLAGKQFEKAKLCTDKCVELTRRTVDNIENAGKYIDELLFLLEEYCKCTYKENSK